MGKVRETVGENQQDKRVPANDTHIKQVSPTHISFRKRRAISTATTLLASTPPVGPNSVMKLLTSGFIFKSPEVKCDESCG